ncbi:hypothetical protein D9611_002965 [Ephemerocybe angulata]|uniref:Fungal-type protein kinase domain-containing protein n=1 Tax=Ephemerocybe angulata TaxID=980116 RepID=A0A8H5FI54_9AGAR|nr:hypothetical protein D9611_002965 [Tulosesus angulatus]
MYHTTPSNGTYAGESANEPLSSEAKETRRLLARVLVIEEGWTDTFYHDLEEESTLTDYLSSSSSGYGVDSNGKGRWTALPHTPVGALQLSARLTEIISSIIAHLSVHGENGATPTGPSFEKPRPAEAYLGWSNVASAFSVRPDGLPLTGAKQVSSIVDQCQEIFAHQPNRNFLREWSCEEMYGRVIELFDDALLAIEKEDGILSIVSSPQCSHFPPCPLNRLSGWSRARLVHCDHSGVYLTPFFNFHDRPRAFVRLILGLSSRNEAVLGFDTSVQWKVNPSTGRKSSGLIKIDSGDNGLPIFYVLRMNQPPFVRRDFIGRGTTCWRAIHPVTGARVLIKDAWRPESRLPESVFLDAARGIDGVAEVLSHHDRMAETKNYRPEGFKSEGFENRIKSRVILKQYGQTIDHFTSRFQAIAALRDVVVANLKLLSRGILHKDISIQNILFGAPGATPGVRGILIDLDMANWLWSTRDELRANAFMGTRRFQSVSVLMSEATELFPIYGYLDDLESLFYVLCNIVLLYEKPGTRWKPVNERFADWDDPDPRRSAYAKHRVFDLNLVEASDFWGEVCEELVRGFKAILKPILDEKDKIRDTHRIPFEEKCDRLEAIGKELDCAEVYGGVIKLFDDALQVIEKEDNIVTSAPSVTPASTVMAASAIGTPNNRLSGLKRRLDEDHPDASLSTRLRPIGTDAEAPCILKEVQ